MKSPSLQPQLEIELQKRLGYFFENPPLLHQALTHGSQARLPNYQRLELLGDAVLDLVVAWWLYQANPEYTPGQLTTLRSRYVCEKALAQLARKWGLQYAIHCSVDADAAGVRESNHVLSDTAEAVIGALFLDTYNVSQVQRVIIPWLKQIDTAPRPNNGA